MTSFRDAARQPVSPASRLRLLGTWAPAAAVVFGLLAAGSAVSVVRNLVVLVGTLTQAETTSAPLLATVVGMLVSALVATVAGLVAHRLAVEVPQVLRGWQDALAERARLETGHEPTGSPTSPR